jgi:hypothetical protein
MAKCKYAKEWGPAFVRATASLALMGVIASVSATPGGASSFFCSPASSLKNPTHSETAPSSGSDPNDARSNIVDPSDSAPELLLMDVVYEQLRVDSALSVLQDHQGRRYLPLRQFASGLGFRLHVDLAKKRVTGFFNSPSQQIAIDVVKGTYKQGLTAGRFDPALCFEQDGDLYIESELFSRIAGLHLGWQMNLLQLQVTAPTSLNVVNQWILRAKSEVQQVADNAQQNFQRVTAAYKFWSIPAVDAQIYRADDSTQGSVESSTALSVNASGDLLMMSAQFKMLSDSQGHPSELMSLGRSDPNAQLLGSMHATQFQFGDLYLPEVPLLARARNALGITVSNYPLPGAGYTQNSQVKGKSVPGATMELYEHDQLYGTTTADAQGNYQFSGLRLDPGPNNVQVVTVKQDGDVEESNRRIYGDIDGPNVGESRYRLTAGRVGSSVYGTDIFGTVQNQDSEELIGEFQKGLGNGTWASALAATTQNSHGVDEEAGLGIHSWLGNTLTNLNTMFTPEGGTAVSAGIARKLGAVNVSLERTQASGDLSQRILPEIDAVGNALTSLQIDESLGKHGHFLAYGLDVDRLEGENPTTLLRGRFTAGNTDFLLSNALTMRLSDEPTEITGFAQVRKGLGSTVGLLDVGYELSSGPPLQLARLTFNRNLSSTYSARMGLEYDINKAQPLSALTTLYRGFGPVDVGLNLQVSTAGRFSASLLFSTGIGSGGGTGLELTRPGVSQSGVVAVRAFIDKHLSGKYERDDPLLPGVTVLVNGHPRAVATGKNGRAVINRLSPNQPVSISADEDSFENPAWVSENPGVSVVPRAGRPISIDFPVLETGEIQGGLIEPRGVSPPPGLSAELVDQSDHVLDTSILDASGTYVFSRVRPAVYKIRLIDLDGKQVVQRDISVGPAALLKNVDIDVSASTPNTSSRSISLTFR